MPIQSEAWSDAWSGAWSMRPGVSMPASRTRASLFPAFRHCQVPFYPLLSKRTLMQWIWILACLVWMGIVMPGSGPAPADSRELVISADRQFAYADTLFNDEDFSTAEVEFKRFIHFFPEDTRILEAAYKTGMALFFQERFHNAARQFNDIIRDDPDISNPFTQESYFMQSRAFMHLENMGYAQVVLQNFVKLTDDPDTRDRIYLDLAKLHIRASLQPGTDELDQALAYLEKIPRGSAKDAEKKQLTARIQKTQSVPEKSPVLAGILAAIPGSGFLYTGRVHDAAAAFLVNTGLGLAAWKAFDQDNPALGGVVALVGGGFYTGSIYGSVSAAHKHNHTQKIRILNRQFYLDTTITPGNPTFSFTLNHPF
ncbi:MAG: tol-pal system YbgF family protein [Desulfotignum sp.]